MTLDKIDLGEERQLFELARDEIFLERAVQEANVALRLLDEKPGAFLAERKKRSRDVFRGFQISVAPATQDDSGRPGDCVGLGCAIRDRSMQLPSMESV